MLNLGSKDQQAPLQAGRAPKMQQEIFDICDENDNVIGQEIRSVVHEKNLLHRAVHIWVWNSRNELMIHLRSPEKDQYPNCFTSSASGHVDRSESYEHAANRELQEELRMNGDLQFATRLPASPDTAYEHTALYNLYSDETPIPDPSEITSIHYFSPSIIEEMIRQQPERFTPPFQELFKWWMSQSSETHQTA